MKRYIALLALVACSLVATAFGGTHKEGLAWLEANKQKEGVITLESGLQYKVLKKGDGNFHPKKETLCETHYEGTLIDGTVFDSSYKRGSPTSFAPNQVIKGWTEAMQLMVEGDKWELYLPSELAYGDHGSGDKIKGGDPLIFLIELIEIKGEKVPADKCDVETLEGCSEKQVTFLNKFKADEDAAHKELKRLSGINAKKLKRELADWLEVRKNLLRKLGVK